MDATPHAAGLRLAQARIGAVDLGIPVQAVVQAIPLPDTPAFLPRRQGALRGVVEHLGTLVPVVDLARWSTPGPPLRRRTHAFWCCTKADAPSACRSTRSAACSKCRRTW